jgi:hypothetical protein
LAEGLCAGQGAIGFSVEARAESLESGGEEGVVLGVGLVYGEAGFEGGEGGEHGAEGGWMMDGG